MRTYTYADLVVMVERVLGERVSRSTLRMAQTEPASSSTRAPRITAGMPAPLPAASPTSPAQFDADLIDVWLQGHPRLAWNRAVERADGALRAGEPVENVIRQALADGLSWRVITRILNTADGGTRTVAGIHKRFRYLAP